MRKALILLPLFFLPLLLNDFWLTQVVTRALILGVTALSLTFLATYLGVVSFAQAAMAGVAGYTIAYFGVNSVTFFLFFGALVAKWAPGPKKSLKKVSKKQKKVIDDCVF